ncbi:MAG TPA: hypothetical protein V6C65_03550 [Allocoleopsis sp.]
MLSDEQKAFAKDMVVLLQKAWELGYEVTMGECYRTVEQQQIYVRTGRSKTMKSNHMNRTAVDLNLFKDGKLCTRDQIKPLGDFWENLNPKNRWGGNWRGLVDEGRSHFIDSPHFERNV